MAGWGRRRLWGGGGDGKGEGEISSWRPDPRRVRGGYGYNIFVSGWIRVSVDPTRCHPLGVRVGGVLLLLVSRKEFREEGSDGLGKLKALLDCLYGSEYR